MIAQEDSENINKTRETINPASEKAETKAAFSKQFGKEWVRFRGVAARLIGRFRTIEKENPQVDLQAEERQMQELAGNFDDLSAKTELELELTEEEKEKVEALDPIVQDTDFDSEEITDRSELVGIKEEYEEAFKKKYVSEEEKKLLKKKGNKEIPLYEPNGLTEQEVKEMLSKIQGKITEETDEDRISLYQELYGFIQRNGCIFTEFSHGTCAVSLNGILEKGVLPLSRLPEQNQYQKNLYRGERGRINSRRTREQSVRVSAGIGRDGLGLAIGYARREDDPMWMGNGLTDQELINYVSPPDFVRAATLEGNRYSREWYQYVDERHRAYFEAYRKLCESGKDTWTHTLYVSEFPMVIGFNKSDKVEGVRAGRFATSHIFDGFMTGEVGFWEDDIIPPNMISAIACPKRGKRYTEANLRRHGMREVDVISLEALGLLPEFGINQVKEKEEYVFKELSKSTKALKIDEMIRMRMEQQIQKPL